MPAILSEVLKFQVKLGFRLDSPSFAALRRAVINTGVKEQYYGMSTDHDATLLWIINWPKEMCKEQGKGPEISGSFRASVNDLDLGNNPTSWCVPFEDSGLIQPALSALVCQICGFVLKKDTQKEPISESLHKTFTDCYQAPGFTGGYWNSVTSDDRSVVYYLGWESRKVTTSVFAYS